MAFVATVALLGVTTPAPVGAVGEPTVSGRVTDAADQPIANAQVSAFSSTNPAFSAATAWTDANGDYTLTLFQPGSYAVSAKAPGLAPTFTDGTFVIGPGNTFTANTNDVLVGRNVQLVTASATISGTVTNTAGAPLQFATVSLGQPGSPALLTSTSTDADGNFSFPGLAPGGYTLSAWASGYQFEFYDNADQANATPIVVAAGETADRDIVVGTGGTVTGNVLLPDGSTPFFATITLLRWPVQSSSFGNSTNFGGSFSLNNVAAGQYVLRAQAQGGAPVYSGGSSTYAGATPFTVVDGQTSGPFTLTLGPLGTITGTVLDADGQPVANASVNGAAPDGSGQASTTTNEFGQYTLTGVSGSTRVQVNPPQGSPWLYEWWTAAGGTRDFSQAEAVNAIPGQTLPGIDFQLDRGGEVSGRVLGPNGEPYRGLFVTVIGRSGTFGGFTSTDATGNYTVRGIAPDPDLYVWVQNLPGFFDGFVAPGTSSLDAPGFAIGIGGVVAGQDIILRRAGGASFTTIPAGPFPGGVIVCPGTTAAIGPGFQTLCDGGARSLNAQSTGAGGFFAGGVGSGTYTAAAVTFSGIGEPVTFATTSITDAVTCTLGQPGQPVGTSACTVAPGGTITGRVTAPNATRPDTLVEVLAYNAAGQVVGRTLADAFGYYRLIGVPAGAVRIGTTLYGQSSLSASFFGGETLATATPVTVTSGGTVQAVNFALIRGISGTVRFVDAVGAPFPTAGTLSGPVVCPSAPTNSGITCSGVPFAAFAAVAGEVGVYRVGPINAGTFDVTPIYNMSQVAPKATIAVTSADTFDCEVTMPSGPITCDVFPDPTAGGDPGDDDNVDDAIEDGAPNGGDGNDDGTPDAVQENVTSLPAVGPSAGYITIEAPSGTSVANVTVDPVDTSDPEVPDGAVEEVGLIGFEVDDVTPGSTQEVVIYLPAGVTPTGYAKYLNGTWIELPESYYDLSVPGQITLTLTDGDPLVDEDGLPNGVIADPGIPLVAPDEPPVTFGGFYSPVDMGGTVNVVKGGSTVPLKFEMFQGGTELTSPADVASFRVYQSSACASGAPADEVEFTTLDPSGLTYTNGRYQQNWKTPKVTGCYRAVVEANDGSTLSALFRLR